MTISSTVRKAGPFDGTGSQTEFPFEFKVFSESDLYVVNYNETTEVETVLDLDTDYTVTLNEDQDSDPGGTVTLDSALATNYTLTITSDIANLQPTDLTNRGGFYPTVINDALDRACIQIQQLQDYTDRTLKTAVSSTADTTLPPPKANDLLGWDSTGSRIANINPSTLATIVAYATAYADTFISDGSTLDYVLTRNPGTIYNLDVSISGVTQVPVTDYTISGSTFSITTAAPLGTEILVKYREALPNTSGDSQDFRYLPAGVDAVATTVQTKLRETVSVKDFGAVGDGVANDTDAIQAAIDYAIANGNCVKIPAGTFLVQSQITVDTRTANAGVFRIIGTGGTIAVPGGDISGLNTDNFTDIYGRSTGGVLRVMTPDSDEHSCFIQGVHFYKPDTSYPSKYSTFINISQQRNVHVDSCVFGGGYDKAILVTGVYGCTIKRCSLTGFNIAIHLRHGANTITISDNSIRNGRKGILIETVDNADVNVNLKILSNYFESMTGIGIDAYGVRASDFSYNYFEVVDSGGNNYAFVLQNSVSPATEPSSRNTFLGNYGNSMNALFTGDTGNNIYIGNVGFTLTDANAATWYFDTSGNLKVNTLSAPQESATSATLVNSWANTNAGVYGAARFWRDQFGNVHLAGNIGGGTINTTAFTLPEGYRPEFEMLCVTNSNGDYGQIRITNTGLVIPRIGSTSSVSLENITFRAYVY